LSPSWLPSREGGTIRERFGNGSENGSFRRNRPFHRGLLPRNGGTVDSSTLGGSLSVLSSSDHLPMTPLHEFAHYSHTKGPFFTSCPSASGPSLQALPALYWKEPSFTGGLHIAKELVKDRAGFSSILGLRGPLRATLSTAFKQSFGHLLEFSHTTRTPIGTSPAVVLSPSLTLLLVKKRRLPFRRSGASANPDGIRPALAERFAKTEPFRTVPPFRIPFRSLTWPPPGVEGGASPWRQDRRDGWICAVKTDPPPGNLPFYSWRHFS